MASVADLYFTFRGDDSQLANDAQAAGDRAANAVGDKAGTTLGQKLAANAKRGITVAGGAIGTFVAGSVEKFAGFQERMNEVFTLLPDITEREMGKMTDDVKAFSRETGRTTDEVVPALYASLSAGVPPDNVFEFMRTANKAATAGAASTTDSINLLSAVTKGYGDTSQEAVEKVADLAFQTVKLGQTTYPELAASMGKVVPLASALAVEQEDLFGATATLTGVTGNTAEVMTQLKATFTALIKANPQMLRALDKMGFSSGAAAIESLGLKGTLDALVDASGGSTQALAEMLGSSEALTAVLALTGAQADVFTDKTLAMGDATGSVDDAFRVMDSGIAATGRKIAATVGTIALEVGEKFAGIGPLLMAMNQGGMLFGVSPARLFGGLAGTITGRAIPAIVGAFKGGMGKALAPVMSSSIAQAILKSRGAAAIAGATGKLGTFLGTKIGMAMSVAIAAAAVVAVVATYNDIKDGLDEQSAQIGKDVGDQITKGTTESLEQSRAALQSGIDRLSELWYNPFAGGQKDQLQRQLEAVDAELQRRAAETPEALAARLEEGKARIDAAAGEMVDGIPDAVGAAGAKIPDSIAAGVLSQQNAVVDAMDTLKNLMKNALTPAQRIARNIGILTSKELASGLNDKRPEVRAEAQRVQAMAEQELAELIAAGGTVGKKAGAELEKALRSKNPDVRAAAQRVQGIVTEELAKTKKGAGDAGGAAGRAFVERLRAAVSSGKFTVNASVGFTLPGKAAGGPVAGGQPIIVGEEGWEVYVPHSDGYIVPHDQAVAMTASGGGSGAGVTVNVYNPKPEPASTSTRRELRKLALSGSPA